jgi:hypothetical protein
VRYRAHHAARRCVPLLGDAVPRMVERSIQLSVGTSPPPSHHANAAAANNLLPASVAHTAVASTGAATAAVKLGCQPTERE